MQVAGQGGSAGPDAEVPPLAGPFLRTEDEDVLRAVDGPARQAADIDDLNVGVQLPVLVIAGKRGHHDHDGHQSGENIPALGHDAPPLPAGTSAMWVAAASPVRHLLSRPVGGVWPGPDDVRQAASPS